MSIVSWQHLHRSDNQVHVHPSGSYCDLGYASSDDMRWNTNVVRAEAGYPELPQDEWAVNLNVRDKSTKKADEVYWAFCELSRQLRLKDLDYVSVSCFRATEEDELDADETEEFHDENTLVKVRAALYEALGPSFPRTQVDDIINSMQTYGILFRERR